MEVKIPQQALGKALARGIATDSPAFFGGGKSLGKKDCPNLHLFYRLAQIQHCFDWFQRF